MDQIPLSRPDITERDSLVTRVLRSGRLSIGPMVELFEEMVAERTRREHAVACSSGTAGLHMALSALNIGPGDEVITTPFTFIAAPNSILFVGATPVFVDICPKTLNMDPKAVEAAITPRTKAILAVENFGNPAHMSAYRAIADRHEIKLVEDACEGLGGRHGGRAVGEFGHVSVFGFYPNKQITTGEGGMVVTNDDRVADVMRSLRNQGRPTPRSSVARSSVGTPPAWMQFERLGYNYRMCELQAALGVAQMERLDEILRKRQQVAERYIGRFMAHSDLILPNIDDETMMSWFVFIVRLSDRYSSVERNRIIEGMHRHEVGASAYFPCAHLQPQFALGRDRRGEFPISESVSQRTIAIPFYNSLTDRDAEFAAATLELMLSRENLTRS